MAGEAERFWAKVEKGPSCWKWKAAIDSDGYGVFYCSRKKNNVKAHRRSLELAGVELQPKLLVDHICRNRQCTNPQHLRAVTARTNSIENSVSPAAKNAAKTHCKNGHALTVDNLVHRNNRSRHCKTCHREYYREYLRLRRRKKYAKSSRK